MFGIICVLLGVAIFWNAFMNYSYKKQKIKKKQETPEYKLEQLKENITSDFYAQGPYGWSKIELEGLTKYVKGKWVITFSYERFMHIIYFDNESVLSLYGNEIQDFINQIERARELDTLNQKYNPQRTKDTKEVFEDLEKIEKKKKEIEDIREKYKSDFDKTFK